jgi:RES domain-containing protein
MPVAWRIVKASRVASAFDGEGARLYGGRWNSPGHALVYTAENVSLAALELLVHLQESALLASYLLLSVRFPPALVRKLARAALPATWNAYPAPLRLRQLGDAWIAAGTSAVLEVPSAVVPAEKNYLLNPAHPGFQRVTLGTPQRFSFDRRLARRDAR